MPACLYCTESIPPDAKVCSSCHELILTPIWLVHATIFVASVAEGIIVDLVLTYFHNVLMGVIIGILLLPYVLISVAKFLRRVWKHWPYAHRL